MTLTLQAMLIAQPFCLTSCLSFGLLATNMVGLHASLALDLGLPQGRRLLHLGNDFHSHICLLPFG